MSENPFDQLSAQLPGRILTLEILVTLLLRRKSDAVKILRETEAILLGLEASLHEGSTNEQSAY
ncbi:hypothetical protein ACKI1Q_46060, partial [Streptomyces galilaeus]|uniref:hypothetical protein n=1 Tax=Streptomyces galilaeus TaxID=33899 RepID=UPI0038F72B4D